MATDYRTSLRFNERHNVTTISSNLGLSLMSSRPQDSRHRRSMMMFLPAASGTTDNISVVAAAPAQRSVVIKQTTTSPPSRYYNDELLSTSMPNFRRLLELQQQHYQQYPSMTPARALKQSLHIQPFGMQDQLRATPTTPTPIQGRRSSSGNDSPSTKLQAVNRSLVRSRHMAMRNTCDLEAQQEERIKADLINHRKKILDLTRMVHDHLKAENRPNKGLFYEMIFSKRLDKSRQTIRENQFGVVDALSPEAENLYHSHSHSHPQQPSPSAAGIVVKSVLKKSGHAEPLRYETPTRVALSIAKQLDPERQVQVGINGRMFLPSPVSSGWSSTSTPVSTANSDIRGQKKRVEIRL